MRLLRRGRSISNHFRWGCPLLAIVILSLALATGLAGMSHAADVERLYAVSFNGSLYPPGIGLFNDTGNVTGNIYLYAIDTAGARVLSAIRLDEPAYFMVASPSGERLYLTDGRSRNITVVDPINLTVPRTFSLNGSVSGIAMSPDGSRLYATLRDRQAIYALDVTNGSVREIIPVNNTPYDLAMAPDGKKIYAVDSRNDSVAVIDVPGNRQITILMTGARPLDVAVNPASGTVYVADYDDNTIAVFDASNYTLKKVIGNVIRPSYLATDVQQSWVFVTSFSGGNLSQIDGTLDSMAVLKQVNTSCLGKPVVSGDGVKIFVPDNGRKSIIIMNAASLAITGTVNITDPVQAMTVGTVRPNESVASPAPTTAPTSATTPTPKPAYYPGNWGTPTPFYLPLPIPPKVSPIAVAWDPGIFGYKSWFPPITIKPVTQNDIVFILLIFIIVFIVLAGITYIMMFKKDDDD